jgi:hypothetical protein
MAASDKVDLFKLHKAEYVQDRQPVIVETGKGSYLSIKGKDEPGGGVSREAVARMGGFAAEQGMDLAGPHHKIYLSDPGRVPPKRLKTILRHPLRESRTAKRK